MKLDQQEITRNIIGAAFKVNRILDGGSLERVYQKAGQMELKPNEVGRIHQGLFKIMCCR